MKIDIAQSANALGQPHFWHLHDKHLREHDGEPAYELPLAEIIAYHAAHKDDALVREALMRITGTHGLHTDLAAIYGGETAIGKCFMIPKGSQNPALKGDWVELDPLLLAAMLATGAGHPRPDHQGSWKAIQGHVVAIAKMAGLEPNLARIERECCPDCQKQAPAAEATGVVKH